MKTRKVDTSRKAWETYRKENLSGLGHNSLALSYSDWKDKQMNEHCLMLEKESKHTPTPWYTNQCEKSTDHYLAANGHMMHRIGETRTAVDAEYIVRAVNSHKELLQIAKDWLEYRDAKGLDPEQSGDIREVIAKAEGKEI